MNADSVDGSTGTADGPAVGPAAGPAAGPVGGPADGADATCAAVDDDPVSNTPADVEVVRFEDGP